MEYEELPVFGQLIRQKGDIEVKKNSLEEREGLFDTEQEREPVDLSRYEDIHQELVDQDEEDPQRQKLVCPGLVFLANQQELDEDGNTDACDKEHAHSHSIERT